MACKSVIKCVLTFILITTVTIAEQGALQAAKPVNNKVSVLLAQDESDVNQTVQYLSWDQLSRIPELIAKGEINAKQIPDPHWSENGCKACHTQGKSLASKLNLRKSRKDAMCLNCHDASFDHSYIHPVDIKPDSVMQKHISKEFKDSLSKTSGRMSCVTCHNLVLQCLPENKKEQGMNPKFFRGGPFKTRSEQCFYCHDENKYLRLNPHDQIDKSGKIKDNTCNVCHSGSIKALKQAKSASNVKFNIKSDLKKMCLGCHKWTPHPGGQFSFFSEGKGPDHLVKPSKFVKEILGKMSKKHNVTFPLEPGTNRIYCGTCHNVHEKGVIKSKSGAKGADSERRLRVKSICQYCHYK